jgi:hypothetical protein
MISCSERGKVKQQVEAAKILEKRKDGTLKK